MRTKINIISWVIFLVLMGHMSVEKTPSKELGGHVKVEKSKLIAKKIFKKKGHG